MNELALNPPASTSELTKPPSKDKDWLVLSTIYSAKEFERDTVYLIHTAYRCLPSGIATGSDKKIKYALHITDVAMTRARDFLYIL